MPTGVSHHARLLLASVLIASLLLLSGGTPVWAAKKAAPPASAAARKQSARPVAPPSAAAAVINEWGPYLDVAYELTYWDKAEIKEWRLGKEREIGLTLAGYIAQGQARLAPPADENDIVSGTGRPVLHRDRDYLRLAIALMIDYLGGGAADSLNSAVKLLGMLQGKTSMPEIAYWTGFGVSLQAMESRDSARFVAQVYGIWNNAVTFMEQAELTTAGAAGSDRRSVFYCRNLVNLVVNRAIIDRQLADLNALGPLFIMLGQRDFDEREGDGLYYTTLVKRICDGMTAPDSDRYRLNFTVAVIEAKRLQQLATGRLDTERMTPAVQQLFQRVRTFNDYAMQWAESSRSSGAVNVITDSLDLTSFAIQRLSDNQQSPAFGYFAMFPSHDGSITLLKAMAIFNDLAPLAEGGWEKAGYAGRDVYLKSLHRLWRAIMELSLWTGDYYLTGLSTAGQQERIFELAAPLQVALNSYLDFLDSQKSRGFADTIPDSAWFGAAEAAEKLAYAYQKTATYTADSSAYNLWFQHRLQAAELFPFDAGEIARTAASLRRDGRFNLFLDYYTPLGTRLRNSAAVRKWLEEEKGEPSAVVRDYLAASLKIFSTGSDIDGTSRARQLREELQRKPDHPMHRLLKAFYEEEYGKNTPFTRLLKDPSRLNP